MSIHDYIKKNVTSLANPLLNNDNNCSLDSLVS